MNCPHCDGKGWYAQMNCSGNPWEAEQVQCENCLGTGLVEQPSEPSPTIPSEKERL